MRKHIAKIVVASVTTITLIFCFINVKADTQNIPYITQPVEDYNGTFYFLKGLDDIEYPRDLDGMILAFNNVVPVSILNLLNDGDWISIQFPIYDDYAMSGAISVNSVTSTGASNYLNKFVVDGFRIIKGYGGAVGSFALQYLRNGVWTTIFIKYANTYSYFLGEWNIVPENEEMGLNAFLHLIFLPIRENKAYINYYFDSNLESFGTFGNAFEVWKTYFQQSFVQIIPQNYRELLNSYYEEQRLLYGEQQFNLGYNEGLIADNSTYRFEFLTGVMNAVGDVLAIEIFPNIQLGYFILIPLALGITGMIFWFWRKD